MISNSQKVKEGESGGATHQEEWGGLVYVNTGLLLRNGTSGTSRSVPSSIKAEVELIPIVIHCFESSSKTYS